MASPGEDVYLWSATAASNNSADALINWAEGQLPGTVNDSARGMMAALAKQHALRGGGKTTGGSANAHTLTSGVGYTALPNPFFMLWKAGATNTGATTLNVDSIGAVSVVNVDGVAMTGGEIRIDNYYWTLYNGSNHIILNPSAGTIRVGAKSVTTVSSIDLTLSSTYDEYEFHFTRLDPATAGATLLARISTDSGSNYKAGASDYRWAVDYALDGATTVQSGSTGDTSIQLAASMAGSGSNGHLRVTFTKPGVNGITKHIYSEYAHVLNATSAQVVGRASGRYVTDSSPVTNIRFLMSSGNIAAADYIISARRV